MLIKPVPAVPVYAQKKYRDPNRSIFAPSHRPSAPSLAEYLEGYYVPPASGDWQHGVCGCFEREYAERNCTFTCCCVHVCCEPFGPCCAWASMAAAMGVENTDEIFRRQACAYCLIDTGNRCTNYQNDQAKACGAALSAVGYAALVWIRTTARLQLAQWLGLSNAQSNFLQACCCVFWCNPLATIQEIDSMADAYKQIQVNDRVARYPSVREMEVVYSCNPIASNRLCCFMQERWKDGSFHPLRRLPPRRIQRELYPLLPGTTVVAAPLCMDREEHLPLLALPH